MRSTGTVVGVFQKPNAFAAAAGSRPNGDRSISRSRGRSVLAAFTWHSLSQARTSLNDARAAVNQLESNKHELLTASGRAAAGRTLAKISADAAAADQTLRSSTGLKVFGWLPVLHTQRQGLLDLASDVHSTATTGDQLLSQVNAVVADSHGSTVSITQLENLRAAVNTAVITLRGLNRPSSGLIGSLGDARTKFDNADATFVNQLVRASRSFRMRFRSSVPTGHGRISWSGRTTPRCATREPSFRSGPFKLRTARSPWSTPRAWAI